MRIIILGGGISGLSLAWFLRNDCDVLVLEREACAGGWLKTEFVGNFLFDKGPRTFRMHQEFKELISALNLEDELILSSLEAKKRYLWGNKGFYSPFRFETFCSLLKEWRVPCFEGEETIFEFAMRRFNREVTETLFDAITLGVYGGEMRELSMNACFPKIKEWEREYGSLSKALLKQLTHFKKKGLFSFKKGSQTLCDALVYQLGDRVKLNEEVKRVRFSEGKVHITTQNVQYDADFVVSALPFPLLKNYFPALHAHIKMQSLQVVHCGFDRKVLPLKGFGYLIPTREKEALLGAVFDSHIFPQQNRSQSETRLTMMVKHGQDAEAVALESLRRHLKIVEAPSYLKVCEAKEAIPQFQCGHRALIDDLKRQVATHYPRLSLTGNYLSGVSVADCIATSRDLSECLLQSWKISTKREDVPVYDGC